MKKSNLTKFLTFVLAFMLSIISVKAQTYSTSEVETNITYLDTSPAGFWGTIAFYTANGELAYCIEPHKPFEEGDKNQISIDDYHELSEDIKRHIELIDYYAKKRGSLNNPEIRTTAQLMIWEVVRSTFKVENMEFENYTIDQYNQISQLINQDIARHSFIPSFHQQVIELKAGESITLQDTQEVLSDFVLNNSNEKAVSFIKNNNSLSLTGHSSGSSIITGQKVNDEHLGVSLVFVDNITQAISTLKVRNNIEMSLQVNVIESGSFELLKRNPTQQPIVGAQFLVSKNSDMSSPIGTFTTDSTGRLIVTDLLFGTYYVQEIFTPNPYQLDNTIYEVSVPNNELVKIELENNVTQGQIKIIKSGSAGQFIKGIVFEVFDSNQNKVDTITTDDQGIGLSKVLELGDYTVIETSVVEPYLIDPKPINVSLKYKDQLTPIVLQEVPVINQIVKGQIEIIKKDSENLLPLASVEFELKDLKNNLITVLKTDDQGKAVTPDLDLGAYTLKEIKAAEGYLLDETIHPIELKYVDDKTPLIKITKELFNEPIKGKIKIVKVNSSNEEKPVAGAHFNILSLPGREVVESLVSDENGFAISSDLRMGEYLIVETAAPEEFYLNPNEYPVVIKNHQETIVNYISNDQIEIKLGLIKTDSETKLPLENAVFEIHDNQGNVVEFSYLDDKYQLIQQTQLITNSKGEAYTRGFLQTGKYTLVEVKAPSGYLKGEPIEFSINRNTTTIDLETIGRTLMQEISNNKTTTEIHKKDVYDNFLPGAVLSLYDADELILTFTSSDDAFEIKGLEVGKSYTLIEEIAPDGYLISDPVVITINETSEPQIIEMINEFEPTIFTTAIFDTGVKESLPISEVMIIDQVKLEKLWLSQPYQLTGTVIDVETNEVITTSTLDFIAENESMQLEMNFDLNGDQLESTQLVVTQLLKRGDKIVAEHNDLLNEDQMIRFPSIQTLASSHSGTKELLPVSTNTIIDQISYTNLTPYQTYQIHGKLVLKEDLTVISSAEISFTPIDSNGVVALEFSVDTTQLSDNSIVVFEEVYNQGVLIAMHTDSNDENQTVTVLNPKLSTIATSKVGEKELLPLKSNFIVDKIWYENLIPNQTYQLKGQLVLKEDESVLAAQEINFTPIESQGEIELEFPIDTSQLVGKEIVVFEEVYYQEELIAQHRELNDKNQTVKVLQPTIKTSASPKNRINNNVVIVDKVMYSNLLVGQEYTLQGILMDKETNQPFLVNNQPVTTSKTFITNNPNGEIELEFKFDQNALYKTTLVVFEELYYEDELISSHKDINDEEQSVIIHEIELLKVDSSDESILLKDAEFTISQNDSVLATKQTDENGKIAFYVESGSYQINETKAPIGYQLASNTIDLEDVNASVSLTIMNKKIVPLPKTGDELSPFWYFALSIGLISLGVRLMVKKKKREE